MWRKPRHQGTTDCRQVEAALTAYLKDGLSAAHRQAIDEHLAACETCTRSLQQTQVLESELRLQAAHHNPTLSATASARINERVYRRMRRGLIMQRAVRIVGIAVAVVAIALLAVGAMALWQGQPSEVGGEPGVAPGSGEGAPALVPATSEPTLPSATPGPKSCEEVEGVCLELTWDGENCTYRGPEEIKAGRATFLFRNESEEPAWTNLTRLLGDKTIQDVIDYNNQDPTPVVRPSWAQEYYDDVYGQVFDWAYPGVTYIWEGSLESGIHAMGCGTNPPFAVWVEAGPTVVD